MGVLAWLQAMVAGSGRPSMGSVLRWRTGDGTRASLRREAARGWTRCSRDSGWVCRWRSCRM